MQAHWVIICTRRKLVRLSQSYTCALPLSRSPSSLHMHPKDFSSHFYTRVEAWVIYSSMIMTLLNELQVYLYETSRAPGITTGATSTYEYHIPLVPYDFGLYRYLILPFSVIVNLARFSFPIDSFRFIELVFRPTRDEITTTRFPILFSSQRNNYSTFYDPSSPLLRFFASSRILGSLIFCHSRFVHIRPWRGKNQEKKF